MSDQIEQAAMDARKRAHRDRKSPIQEDDAWAFGQGVTAGVRAALDVLRDRSLVAPDMREEWACRYKRRGGKVEQRVEGSEDDARSWVLREDDQIVRRLVTEWEEV